jgi:hypothetical protein
MLDGDEMDHMGRQFKMGGRVLVEKFESDSSRFFISVKGRCGLGEPWT